MFKEEIFPSSDFNLYEITLNQKRFDFYLRKLHVASATEVYQSMGTLKAFRVIVVLNFYIQFCIQLESLTSF